jgi:hypothetical protein
MPRQKQGLSSVKDCWQGSEEGSKMLVNDAQKEVRTVFMGGFWGQLVSSVLWLTSAALGTWVSPKAAIALLVFGGFFIFPATQLLLRLTGGRASLKKENPFGFLAMQVAFTLPICMLLLVPVTEFRLNLFYPAFMIILGAHYLPFTFLYGMQMFIPLSAILIAGGIGTVYLAPGPFSAGGWLAGLTLLIFAWIGRTSVRADLGA